MRELEGKVCIITGGAGSLGLAAARLMIERGAAVTLVDMKQPQLDAARASLSSDRVETIVADVTRADQVRSYFDGTLKRFGRIDVLFANAGNDGPPTPLVEYPEDLFDSIIATHVRGCFLACKYGLPRMQDGGSIIITSSITGLRGMQGSCAYVAAKHAVMGIMRCAAKEAAPRRIRVNTVNPGPVDNEFMRAAERSMTQVLGRDAGAFLDEQIPFGRHGRPEEVAEAVCFLASDRSSYTSGASLLVDGAFCA